MKTLVGKYVKTNRSTFLFVAMATLAIAACSSKDDGSPTTVTTVTGTGSGSGGSAGAGGDTGTGGGGAGAGGSGAAGSSAGTAGAGGTGVTVDAGSDAPLWDGGSVRSKDPRCASGERDAGCACVLATNEDLLNQCTSNQCQSYDNTRIKYPGWSPGQPLPPVP